MSLIPSRDLSLPEQNQIRSQLQQPDFWLDKSYKFPLSDTIISFSAFPEIYS
jgi:hypothetical protein